MPCYHNAPVMLMVLIPGTPHGSTRQMLTLIVTIQCILFQLYAALQAHVLQLLNKVIPIGIKVQLANDKADNLLVGAGLDIADGGRIFVTLGGGKALW